MGGKSTKDNRFNVVGSRPKNATYGDVMEGKETDPLPRPIGSPTKSREKERGQCSNGIATQVNLESREGNYQPRDGKQG